MKAAIVVNLGTPDAPEAGAIGRYLGQFLADPRVVSLPRWLWLPLLRLVILRTRPGKLVPKYRLVWGRRDGPIRSITAALVRRVQQGLDEVAAVGDGQALDRWEAADAAGVLDDGRGLGEAGEVSKGLGGGRAAMAVEMGMTYGRPSIGAAVARLVARGARELSFLPLFPQYAGATTGAVSDQAAAVMQGYPQVEWRLLHGYFDQPLYLEALADSIRRVHAYRRRPFVLFSFHGLPMAQVRAGDPYPQQCRATAEGVAARLGLGVHDWGLSYQSRFGPAAWLRPYTDEVLAALPGEGVTDLLVVCPGFAVDCLETLEEIRHSGRAVFMAAGGRRFSYVKALNASWAHAELIAKLLADC